jgi:hypothetical protein
MTHKSCASDVFTNADAASVEPLAKFTACVCIISNSVGCMQQQQEMSREEEEEEAVFSFSSFSDCASRIQFVPRHL